MNQEKNLKGSSLSKSDFKIAQSCITKLYYKKSRFPSNDEGNDYMDFLAEGGYMVGKLATLLYPDGIEIETGNDHELAIQQTENLLELEEVVLFEPSIYTQGKLIRVDILEKKGKTLNLIEVKAKSWDSDADPQKKKRELKEYIEDLAYQYLVLEEKFPDHDITPFLFMPDKAKPTHINGLNAIFNIEEKYLSESKFRSYEVVVDQSRIAELRADDIMTLVNLKEEVLALQPTIRKATRLLLKALAPPLAKVQRRLDKSCFRCEFSATDSEHPQSGQELCWKYMPKEEHPVSELYHIGSLGGYKNPLVNELIEAEKVSLFDIPLDQLSGKRGARQLIQIEYTRKNQEWFSEALPSILNAWEYPLHFIDFETTASALPHHKGMRPYELVAFQWSCHTITHPGAEPIHHGWLSLDTQFPNFDFAKSLMEHVGRTGTFLMWATHENTVLRTIFHQMEAYQYKNPTLQNWLSEIVRFDRNDEGKFIDMNALTLQHYFHPYMKGKTSIKWTLPAVLQAYSSPKIQSWLENFEPDVSIFEITQDGVTNPYSLLPPLDLVEKAETINEGTGAMRAYEDLLFGLHKGDTSTKAIYYKGLERYCKLDTLAMVIIWEHWRSSLA